MQTSNGMYKDTASHNSARYENMQNNIDNGITRTISSFSPSCYYSLSHLHPDLSVSATSMEHDVAKTHLAFCSSFLGFAFQGRFLWRLLRLDGEEAIETTLLLSVQEFGEFLCTFTDALLTGTGLDKEWQDGDRLT